MTTSLQGSAALTRLVQYKAGWVGSSSASASPVCHSSPLSGQVWMPLRLWWCARLELLCQILTFLLQRHLMVWLVHNTVSGIDVLFLMRTAVDVVVILAAAPHDAIKHEMHGCQYRMDEEEVSATTSKLSHRCSPSSLRVRRNWWPTHPVHLLAPPSNAYSSSRLVSLSTCTKVGAVSFVFGVVVGFTLNRRLRRWAAKLLKRIKDDN